MGKRKSVSNPTAERAATRKSERNKRRKDNSTQKTLTTSTGLRRQREALEYELKNLEQSLLAYETQYLSQSTRGNAVRGYFPLLAFQLAKVPDRVRVNDEERIFSKSQS